MASWHSQLPILGTNVSSSGSIAFLDTTAYKRAELKIERSKGIFARRLAFQLQIIYSHYRRKCNKMNALHLTSLDL